MNKSLGCIVVAVIAVLIVVGIAVGQYNGLVQQREQVNSAWAQVQNAYQRRMDLIPNLVATVKGVANFEKETYTQVAQARAQAGQVRITPDVLNDPAAFQKLEATQAQLGASLARLLAVAENYPQLKANQNFLELQSQLEGTENRISVERRRFNESARAYNTSLKKFPTVIFAGLLGFHERPYFEATTGAERAPEVKF